MTKAQFSSEEFEQLIMQALDDLPEFFKEKLQNVELVVADWPTKAEIQAVGLKPGQLLFGLYQGVPQTRRTSRYSMVLPDKITIYRMPIEQVCRTPERIIHQVQKTVKHELAHHFGIDDERFQMRSALYLGVVPIEPKENVLCHIFSLRRVVQQMIGNTENERLMDSDSVGKCRNFVGCRYRFALRG